MISYIIYVTLVAGAVRKIEKRCLFKAVPTETLRSKKREKKFNN